MDNNLFKNDNIVGNSKIGFEFHGIFKDDDDVLIEKLKTALNREVMFSNVEYKLLEPTENSAVLMKDGQLSTIKTTMYGYYEAIYVMPKILELMSSLKTLKSTYIHFNIGFDKDYCDINNINVMKFILNYNEDSVIKNIGDITANGEFKKLTDIKPTSYKDCLDKVQKQIESLKYVERTDSIYGIDFSNTGKGFISFLYANSIDYKKKWEGILKSVNHTIITLYNSSTYNVLTDEEVEKVEKINKEYDEYEKSFMCYELFKERYKSISVTADLNNDKSVIDVLFPSIKEKLFDIVVCNGVRTAKVNYDSDISRFQIKDITLKGCYHLKGVDIVDSEIQNSNITDCDIYDTKITNSTITNCNIFGYGNAKDSKFKDCFISMNIELKDCDVYGNLGKMGGSMDGGTLKNTSVISDTAEIKANVEKTNVNEIK